MISVTISGDARSRLPVTDLRIFRDFAGKTLLARSALECGSLLPLLRLELARGAAGSKLPAKESGSKLPHSKAPLRSRQSERKAKLVAERVIILTRFKSPLEESPCLMRLIVVNS